MEEMIHNMITVDPELRLSSIDVARHIAYLCSSFQCEYNNTQYEYNNTKIQKLLYMCYGIFLAKYDSMLVDEQPRAWPHGPVFPKVFNYIHQNPEDYAKKMSFSNKRVEKELHDVVRCFGKHTAGKLSAWSHIPNSPWDQVIKDNSKDDPKWNIPIPNKVIGYYFKKEVLIPNG